MGGSAGSYGGARTRSLAVDPLLAPSTPNDRTGLADVQQNNAARNERVRLTGARLSFFRRAPTTAELPSKRRRR